MIKQILLIMVLFLSNSVFSQVGINTTTPQANLDVMGKPSDASKLDGIIAPRITGAQLQAKTYTALQTGAIIYVTVASSNPAGQTVNVKVPGYYFFNGSQWISIASNNSFIPQVVAAGKSTTNFDQQDSTGYGAWSFTVAQNDGNWNTVSNTYTAPFNGYYQFSLVGAVKPSAANFNSYTWLLKYGSVFYEFAGINNTPNLFSNKGDLLFYIWRKVQS